MVVLFKLLRLPQTLPQKPTQTLCPALYLFVVILSNKYSKYSLFTLLSCCVSFLDPGSDKSLYQTPNLTFTTALKSRSAALEIITQGPSSVCSPWFDSFHLIYLPFSLLPLLIFRTSFCIYSSHYLSFFKSCYCSHSLSIPLSPQSQQIQSGEWVQSALCREYLHTKWTRPDFNDAAAFPLKLLFIRLMSDR